MIDENDQREAFEAWMTLKNPGNWNADRHGASEAVGGAYTDPAIELAWQAYREGRSQARSESEELHSLLQRAGTGKQPADECIDCGQTVVRWRRYCVQCARKRLGDD